MATSLCSPSMFLLQSPQRKRIKAAKISFIQNPEDEFPQIVNLVFSEIRQTSHEWTRLRDLDNSVSSLERTVKLHFSQIKGISTGAIEIGWTEFLTVVVGGSRNTSHQSKKVSWLWRRQEIHRLTYTKSGLVRKLLPFIATCPQIKWPKRTCGIRWTIVGI